MALTINTLNPAQAEAVYTAMVALNNVWARAHVRIDLEDGQTLHVREHEDETIQVFIGDARGNKCGGSFEQYENQNAFAAAYGLDA